MAGTSGSNNSAHHWVGAVERTVAGLGYELVDCERGPRGLLRVYVDRVPGQAYESGPGEFVTVDDCEKVTRQLLLVLEVEGCDFERLEVSSPGLDRPLKKPADYERFAGAEVEVTLKAPYNQRRKFTGVLGRADGGAWRLVYRNGKVDEALDFAFDEVRGARLVPVLNFKGRPAPDAAGRAQAGPNEDVDGGRIR